MLDGWDISHLKGGICSSVWSTETFLHDIREPRYKQSNMGCQISRILNDESIGYLEIWYHWDLFLIFLAIPILLGGDTSFLWYVPGSTSFVYNLREPKYKQNNMRHQNSRKKINQYLKFLIMISNFDFFISRLPDIVQKCCCTPDGATDPTFQMRYVSVIEHVCSQRY